MVIENGDVGPTIRERRRVLGLTLKQVAEKVGLSVALVSQVERGVTTPSLSSLVAITKSLGLDVGEMLSQPRGDDAVTRQGARAPYAISPNSIHFERVSSSFAGHALNSIIITEPPGHRSKPMSHEGEEIVFVLEGTVTVELEGKENVLSAGDSIHFASTRTHCTWNHGAKEARILWVGTMDIFGEHLTGLPTSGKPRSSD